MHYTKAEKALISSIWENRNKGTHGWIPRAKGWLTVEPFNEENRDFLVMIYTDNIDDLGYPYGKHVFAMEAMYETELRKRGITQ